MGTVFCKLLVTIRAKSRIVFTFQNKTKGKKRTEFKFTVPVFVMLKLWEYFRNVYKTLKLIIIIL